MFRAAVIRQTALRITSASGRDQVAPRGPSMRTTARQSVAARIARSSSAGTGGLIGVIMDQPGRGG